MSPAHDGGNPLEIFPFVNCTNSVLGDTGKTVRVFAVLLVTILSCGVAILPILIYIIVKKCKGSKEDLEGIQSVELPEIPTGVEEPEYQEYSKVPQGSYHKSIPSCSKDPEYSEGDTKTALESNQVNWDKFVKRVVLLPKSKHLLHIEGIGIDNGRQYLIHERLFRGTLVAYFGSNDGQAPINLLQPAHVIRLVLGILEGLEHIHSAGFLHPRLSPKKVLLNYNGIGKLYDFCLSEDAVNILAIRKPRMNYTLNELAPEGIQRHEYSTASDVWSTAVLIWQMFSDGSLPFDNTSVVNVDAEIIPTLPETWPTKFEYLKDCCLFGCWNLDESLRPTITMLNRSIQQNTDVDTYNLPKMHGGSMAGYYMPMKKSIIDDT